MTMGPLAVFARSMAVVTASSGVISGSANSASRSSTMASSLSAALSAAACVLAWQTTAGPHSARSDGGKPAP